MPTTDLEIILYPELFDERRRDVLRTGEWIVTAWRYSTGIAALRISNSRGYIEALPFMGQILWDAVFDGQSLRMDNMFDMPVSARQIVETYGCFAFHSGLLAAGGPAPAGAVPADALNPGVLSTPASAATLDAAPGATLDAAPGATRAVTGPAAVTSTPPTVRTEKPRAVPWNSTAEWVEAYFRTPDGTILHADILRPKNLPKGTRIPVIMTVSPYTSHLTDQGYLGALNGTTPEFGRPTEPSTRFQDLIDGAHLMERGYAFVQVDTRRTGGPPRPTTGAPQSIA